MDLTHVIAERENKKIYRDGAKAIKVFAEGYSKADILNEALNTARVEETGLPIPKLLAVDTVNGQWAITTEFIEGDTLAALMAAHPEKEDEYLNLFVDIQMKVHACTCPMLNSLTEKMQRKISATDLPLRAAHPLGEYARPQEGLPRRLQPVQHYFEARRTVVHPRLVARHAG